MSWVRVSVRVRFGLSSWVRFRASVRVALTAGQLCLGLGLGFGLQG